MFTISSVRSRILTGEAGGDYSIRIQWVGPAWLVPSTDQTPHSYLHSWEGSKDSRIFIP